MLLNGRTLDSETRCTGRVSSAQLKSSQTAQVTSSLEESAMNPTDTGAKLDTTSPQEFIEYYARESLSESTRKRFEGICSKVLKLLPASAQRKEPWQVLDIGCGPGMQCITWAAKGHRVHGLDINAALIDIARQRASEAGLTIDFKVGSATTVPYDNESMDVCLMPELLEHVQAWEMCVREAVRVLRRSGVLFLSTTNFLCPIQHEFNLPLYSWYPAILKRHFEQLATTTRPALANFARYPAVHWFSFYQLRRYLAQYDLECYDRFQMLDADSGSTHRQIIVRLLRQSAFFRFVGQLCITGTVVFSVKR